MSRDYFLAIKFRENHLWLRLCPDPTVGAYNAPPYPSQLGTGPPDSLLLDAFTVSAQSLHKLDQ